MKKWSFLIVFKCSNPNVLLKNGKFSKLSKHTLKAPSDGFILRCGNCFYCRSYKAQDWTNRLIFEQKLHTYSYFVTLTYDEQHIPKDFNLNLSDVQKFFKRLRKDFKLRYFLCGEYGGRTDRPHYHAIIFTEKLIDDFVYIKSEKQFYSKYITKKWGLGFTTISHCAKEHLAYTALYTTKKLTKSQRYKIFFNNETGLFEFLTKKVPEFLVMSKRPQIGFGYVRDNKSSFLKNVSSIPKNLIVSKIFSYSEIEMINDQRIKWSVDHFWSNGDYYRNMIKFRELEKEKKFIVNRKRNNF